MTMTRILIRNIILNIICLLPIYTQSRKIPICLTGYMTDVQKWVGAEGDLLIQNDYENAIDLSANTNPVTMLSQEVVVFRTTNDYYIKYLSMSRCKLTRVPPIFQLQDSKGRFLYDTLEYLTFFGNRFQDISIPGEQYDFSLNATGATAVNVPRDTSERDAVWSSGFKEIKFRRLKELDLRSCLIKSLPARLFNGMKNLEALYIGENRIHYVDSYAFDGLVNLIHLDFSRNEVVDDSGNMINLVIDSSITFEKLKNLTSLDFSFTKLLQKNIRLLRFRNNKLRRLSLCNTGLMMLEEKFFAKTSLRILDVSKNPGILDGKGILSGIEDTLQVLYGTDISLSDFDIFYKFHQLEILQLSNNEISFVDSIVTRTLKNLQILDLNKNRMTTWFDSTFSLLPTLKLLSLKDNNINVISENMIEDMSHIKYIALSGNFIVCNCYTRHLFDLALRNENNITAPSLHSRIIGDKEDLNPIVRYHNAFQYFNRIVSKRTIVTSERDDEDCIDEDIEGDSDFQLIDYNPELYSCLLISESKNLRFSEVVPCNKSPRGIGYDKIMDDGYNKLLILLIIPCLMLPLAIGFVYRRNFRYCFITFKNSATLSLINKQDAVDDDTIFNYDVFVSYCNEDRGWVLDHLLPHLEADCSISACLHERDFQVGLSILENIVSCMDRSKSIMLIISQQFLLSQWCQFEMHLAQHRLLETRREDLTLVLLEDIPRRLRPNTLHYLMLTKTYIVWPKDESQRALFWRRLKKSFVTQKLKQADNVSLA